MKQERKRGTEREKGRIFLRTLHRCMNPPTLRELLLFCKRRVDCSGSGLILLSSSLIIFVEFAAAREGAEGMLEVVASRIEMARGKKSGIEPWSVQEKERRRKAFKQEERGIDAREVCYRDVARLVSSKVLGFSAEAFRMQPAGNRPRVFIFRFYELLSPAKQDTSCDRRGWPCKTSAFHQTVVRVSQVT